MNIVVLLLLVLGGALYAEYQMKVIWGRPTSFVDSDEPFAIETTDKDTCVAYCFTRLYCVISHYESGVCRAYNFSTVLTVQQLDSIHDSVVSIKTNMNEADSTCPVGFGNILPVNVSIYDSEFPLTEITYTISYVPVLLTFKYNITRLCAPRFTKFIRPKGEYCLMVYASLGTMFNYDQANALCKTHQGILSGLETDEERAFVAEQGQLNNLDDTFGANMFWVSGTRKGTCETSEQVSYPECAGINGFWQTDKYLTNLTGYKWTENNPDGVSENGPIQSCIIIWTEKVPKKLHGLVDDMTCAANQTGYAAVRGFVCGRVAGV